MDEKMQPISEAFALITELGIALGAAPLSKFAGCWEHSLGDRWFIAVNGHRTPTKTSTGLDVPPFHAYVEHGGWPGGLLTPFVGTMVGGLEAEDDLIAELKRAILRAHDGHPTMPGEVVLGGRRPNGAPERVIARLPRGEKTLTQEMFSAKWRKLASPPPDLWLEFLADVEVWLAEDLSALVDTANALRRKLKDRDMLLPCACRDLRRLCNFRTGEVICGGCGNTIQVQR